jgi:threonine dehydrogenase-like Zn-dependent dehydrogenase
MLQLLQNLRDGTMALANYPAGSPAREGILIRTTVTLISAGTERMLLEFGKANLLDKARQQPDKVRQVLDKVRTDGLSATLESVRAKLDQPIALGYSSAGVVLEVGPGVSEFHIGDRVVSNGPHAEVVSVPKNLSARIPDGVTDEAAAFTVVGAIALQGIRLAQPTLGETFVVTGLGLIGLIAVQLLRAHGCRVLGIDFDARKLALAQSFGAETVNLAMGEDPLVAAERFSRCRGVDGVIVTASTKSNEPDPSRLHSCAANAVASYSIGVTGLDLSRDDFYKKELSFQVSCSYGPGRYDPVYEQGGHDYPYPYVRWTAQRNFEAVLDMMADGQPQCRAIDHPPLPV